MLEFNVNNQIITRKDGFKVVADSRNYLRARFEMSDEWTGDVVALFGYGGSFFRVILDEDGCCLVPFEVIKPPFFTVSVFCGDETLVTANTLFVEVEKSGFTEGAVPEVPSPDIWQQYMNRLQQVIEHGLPYIGDNLHWFLYDAERGAYVDTGIVAKGEDGETPTISAFREPDCGFVSISVMQPDGTETTVNVYDGLGIRNVELTDGDLWITYENGISQDIGKAVPEIGTDYWTEEDKAEIVEEVAEKVEHKTQIINLWEGLNDSSILESDTLFEDISQTEEVVVIKWQGTKVQMDEGAGSIDYICRLSTLNDSYAVFDGFDPYTLNRAFRLTCTSDNNWTSEFRALATIDYVEESIQLAILDSWGTAV